MGALARGRASNAACLSEIPGPYLGGRYAGLPEPGSLSVAVSYYYYYYYTQVRMSHLMLARRLSFASDGTSAWEY